MDHRNRCKTENQLCRLKSETWKKEKVKAVIPIKHQQQNNTIQIVLSNIHGNVEGLENTNRKNNCGAINLQ
jgi:hypothetical protein